MKHYWLITALLAVCLTCYSQGEQNIYTIHLGSFIDLKAEDFQDLKEHGYLYTESFNQNLKHLYIGEFKQELAAQGLLTTLQAKGYPDAYLTSRSLENDQQVEVVQLGIEIQDEKILWNKYKNATPIAAVLDGDQIRVVTGPYPSHDATLQKIKELKKLGYGNAFIRTVYSLRLHPITNFEAPELFTHELSEQLVTVTPTPVASSPIPPASKTVERNVETVAAAPESTKPAVKIIVPAVQEIPADFEPEFIAKSGISSGISIPAISPTVKRTSALKLQTALKQAKYYDASLDGFYGESTKKAIDEYFATDTNWKKLKLVGAYNPLSLDLTSDEINVGIGLVVSDQDQSLRILSESKEPIANAYLAYIAHEKGEDLSKINQLMNSANKSVFQNYSSDAGYDFKADYSYENIDQLIGHIALMHQANSKVLVPCWMFQKHNELAQASFSKVDDFGMQQCDPFLSWEVLQNLKGFAMELDAEGINKESEILAASERSKLFVQQKALNPNDQKAILIWHDQLWAGMNNWFEKDPLHKKYATPLKVAFYQSQVHLEDYYLNKGFEYIEAKTMALKVLQTLVDTNLKNFYS